MSNLHKKFVQKQRNESFGLELLSEDPQSVIRPTQTGAPSKDVDDALVVKFYSETKRETFPIQEVYTDHNGLELQTYYSPPTSNEAPVLIFHHGAGSSAMTFCWLAHVLKANKEGSVPGIFVFDARGHGDSSKTQVDFSLQSFSNDFSFVIQQFCTRHNIEAPIFLIGHSLGGAILTNYIMNFDHSHLRIQGLAMIDIVEETALRALLSITRFINRRPKSFRTFSEAVQWHLKTQLLRNETSARISVSDLLKYDDTGNLVWKSDLGHLTGFWDSWFLNLSNNFIKCGSDSKHAISKLLVLSGSETLDRELIIGQMQGKYQLIVFNNTTHAGHFLQEDIPMQLSISIMEFVRRNIATTDPSTSGLIHSRWGGNINH